MATVCTMIYPPRENLAGYYQSSFYDARDYHGRNAGHMIEPAVHGGYSTVPRPLSPRHQYVPSVSMPEPSRNDNSQSLPRSTGLPQPRESSPKVSLPSISSLFSLADSDKSAQSTPQSQQHAFSKTQTPQRDSVLLTAPWPRAPTATNEQTQLGDQRSPVTAQYSSVPIPTLQHIKQESSPEVPRHPYEPVSSHIQKGIPPTPPFRSNYPIKSVQSPSAVSTGSSFSNQQYAIGSNSNVESHDQLAARPRQHSYHARQPSSHTQQTISPPLKRESPPLHVSTTRSPGAASISSQCSPTTIPHQIRASQTQASCGLSQQRQLPSFPPPPPSQLQTPSSMSSAATPQIPTVLSSPSSLQPAGNLWEHHHYISRSSQQNFQPIQDRYICQTCNKAFSRPSSLKIHSHSHTGEKPFKCLYAGCGKAFSVRSNMKRHERGCHSGSAVAGPMTGIPALLQ